MSELNFSLFYVGGTLVLFLVWAAAFDYLNQIDEPNATVTVPFVVVGIVHPAAALAAWHLRRQHRDPDVVDGLGVALIVVSVIAMIAAFLLRPS